jgi:hypothetical protein
VPLKDKTPQNNKEIPCCFYQKGIFLHVFFTLEGQAPKEKKTQMAKCTSNLKAPPPHASLY